MKKYFEKNNRVVIHYLPEEAPAATQGGASK
jgi:hypothetical protein